MRQQQPVDERPDDRARRRQQGWVCLDPGEIERLLAEQRVAGPHHQHHLFGIEMLKEKPAIAPGSAMRR